MKGSSSSCLLIFSRLLASPVQAQLTLTDPNWGPGPSTPKLASLATGSAHTPFSGSRTLLLPPLVSYLPFRAAPFSSPCLFWLRPVLLPFTFFTVSENLIYYLLALISNKPSSQMPFPSLEGGSCRQGERNDICEEGLLEIRAKR